MRVLLRAFYKLAGIIMILLGLFIVVVSWTEFLGIWPNASFLSFLQNTWTYSAILTVVGGFIFALGIVFVRV